MSSVKKAFDEKLINFHRCRRHRSTLPSLGLRSVVRRSPTESSTIWRWSWLGVATAIKVEFMGAIAGQDCPIKAGIRAVVFFPAAVLPPQQRDLIYKRIMPVWPSQTGVKSD